MSQLENPTAGRPSLAVPVTERDHRRGPEDAPVTLVEYADFECPHCGAAHWVVKSLEARLGDRLRIVHRHFPLQEIHANAENAAEASESAAAEGKFWEMHDALFEHQDALDPGTIIAIAAHVGVDAARTALELAQRVRAPRVREDFISGVRSGVNGTPCFFVNGRRHDGPWEEESLFAAIVDAMEEAPRPRARTRAHPPRRGTERT